MPANPNYTGTPMLGFLNPYTFFIGYDGGSPSTLYPLRGLGWSMKDNPAFSTMKAVSAAGRDVRVPLYQNPLHGFQLVFNFLEDDPALNISGNPDTDFRMLYSFYSAMTGAFGEFLYKPRESAVVGQPLASPDANGYVELVYSIGPFFAESVQELNGATPTILVNGMDFTSNCTFHAPDTVAPYSGIVFKINSSPPVGPDDTITANFDFYYRVHFDKDDYSFEEFVYQLFKTGVGLSQTRI